MNKDQFAIFLKETEERLNGRAKSNQVYESLPMRVDLFLELYKVAHKTGCMHGGNPSWRVLFRRIAEGKLIVSEPTDVSSDFDWIDVDGRD